MLYYFSNYYIFFGFKNLFNIDPETKFTSKKIIACYKLYGKTNVNILINYYYIVPS